MTDRELLELAAKAAGVSAQWDCHERGMMIITPDGIDTMSWNPLTDDGDALRLAVKLDLRVSSGMAEWQVRVVDGIDGVMECGADPYVATRRAIVRAAAEIGTSL